MSAEKGTSANPRLVDTGTRRVHRLCEGRRHLIASHPHLLDGTLEDPPPPSTSPPPLTFIMPPSTPSDLYCCEVSVSKGKGMVTVRAGECRMNGEPLTPDGSPRGMNNGAFLELGRSLRLQFTVSSPDGPKRRILPQTPGQSVVGLPPSKPRRTQPQQVAPPVVLERSNMSVSGSGETSRSFEGSQIDPALRQRLKRISREISERKSGYPNRKPPPPYECVGNSIGYQLLLQSHSEVTSVLIDSLYPALKELEMKHSSLSKTYDGYLTAYSSACREGARPGCMHPGDLPTVGFLTELIVNSCSIPHLTDLATKHCPLWMHLVSVFSAQRQNQIVMATKRSANSVLSCMHLGLMAPSAEFQRHGWTTLANIVQTPTPQGKKPALTEPSLMLALSLVEQQLEQFSEVLPLVATILHFLAQVTTTARSCISSREEENTYTPQQAEKVLALFRERNILRHVMKVPQHLRRDKQFDTDYCTLVRALMPTRARPSPEEGSGRETTPTRDATPPAKPPRKPQRLYKRALTEGSIKGRNSRKSRKSRKHRKLPIIPVRPHSNEEVIEASTESPDHSTSEEPESPIHRRTRSLGGAISDSESNSSPSTSSLHTPPPPRRTQDSSPLEQTTAENSNTTEPATTPLVENALTDKKTGESVEKDVLAENGTGEAVSPPVEEGSSIGGKEGILQQPAGETKDAFIDTSEGGEHTSSDTDLVHEHHAVPSGPTSTGANDEGLPPAHKNGTQSEETACSLPQSHTSATPTAKEQTHLSPPSSLPTSPPPTSPDSLANDVQTLLEEIRAPLLQVNSNSNNSSQARGPQPVLLPTVNRESNYYRHSVKRRRRRREELPASAEPPASPPTNEESGVGRKRMSWDNAACPLPLAGQRDSQFFELSGEFLSKEHTALEDISAGHEDMTETLRNRMELLEGVNYLWVGDKGLQAATNALQGCFSGGGGDVGLFIDILHCFCAHKSAWTLAVCVVLLPALRQLLGNQREERCVLTVVKALTMVVQRFSTIILTCKAPQRSKRLSSTADLTQKVVCYNELSSTLVVLGERMAQGCDSPGIGSELLQLKKLLQLFSSELEQS